MIHSQITVPLFGKVNADLLIDFTAGSAMGFVPFLQICQPMPLNISLNLKEELLKAQTPNITTYLGPLSTLWDSSTPSWKFSTADIFPINNSNLTAFFSFDSYFDQVSGNVKWVQSEDLVFKFGDTGFEPTTFTDADFTLSGCNTS